VSIITLLKSPRHLTTQRPISIPLPAASQRAQLTPTERVIVVVEFVGKVIFDDLLIELLIVLFPVYIWKNKKHGERYYFRHYASHKRR